MSQKKIINPLAIDGEVIPLLENPQNIKIHSEFKSTRNFITDKGLMVVTTNEDVLPPLGIVLSRKGFEEFSIENRKFIISESKVYCSQMDTYDKNPDSRIFNIYMRRLMLDDFENGLGIDNKEVEKILMNTRLTNLTEEGEMIWRMISRRGSVDMDRLIGRGRGLTPAWDDFIVGFSAVLRANSADEEIRQIIQELIFSEGLKLTTDISQDYLIKTINGCFSQNIKMLINFIQNNIFDEKSYLNVIKYGGTSGLDTFIGMMSAYASLLGIGTI